AKFLKKYRGEKDRDPQGEPGIPETTQQVTLIFYYWGTAARKLSNTTVPGALASACQVPALISNITPVRAMEPFHDSVKIAVQFPGEPPLSGATSNVTVPAPALCLTLRNFALVALYGWLKRPVLAPPAFR